jgi:hypothetical protein
MERGFQGVPNSLFFTTNRMRHKGNLMEKREQDGHTNHGCHSSDEGNEFGE